MIVNHLTEALRNKIADAVKDYRLPVKNGKMRCPNVFNGYLPPKRSGVVDDFPFVVVRADEGKISRTDGEAETTVSIIIGCYTDEFDGHEYCINVMQRISAALSTLPDDTLDDRYILQDPIEWRLLEEQPYPQWQLDMSTTWKYCAPQPILSEE